MIITRKQFEEEVAKRISEVQRQEYLERNLCRLEENICNLRNRVDELEWKLKRGTEPVPVEATCCKSE